MEMAMAIFCPTQQTNPSQINTLVLHPILIELGMSTNIGQKIVLNELEVATAIFVTDFH